MLSNREGIVIRNHNYRCVLPKYFSSRELFKMKAQSVQWRQIFAGLSAAGGAFALGTTLGWSAPATPRLVDQHQYFAISSSEMGWISSSINIGCAISCLPIGYLMKRFGRKMTMISLVLPFTIGWGLVIFAGNFVTLLAGRFLLGLAGGAFCVSAPQYSAEIAEKNIRGIVGSFFQLMLIAGILFVYSVGAFTTVFWMNVICSLVPLIFGGIFFFMPESPLFLVESSMDRKALESLRCLRGKHWDARGEMNELKSQLSDGEDFDSSSCSTARSAANLRAIVIGLGLILFMQMCGINIVIFYSTVIFDAAGSKLAPDISTIVVGAIHLAASLLGSLLVDKAGRRILLLLSITTMAISSTALGLFFILRDIQPEIATSLGWLPLTSLCIFICGFAVGMGPIPFFMISELYSKDIKTIASPFTGAFNWMIVFVLTLSFDSVATSIGIGQTFLIFAGFSFAGIFFVAFMVPETKGKSMSEIQGMLASRRAFIMRK